MANETKENPFEINFNNGAKYGAVETNGLVNARAYHEAVGELRMQLDWSDPRLVEVTRLRLISDANPYIDWDVSFCHGRTKDGEYVSVGLPFNHLPKKGTTRAIVAYAKRDGVYAKGLGILDNISTLC